MNIIPTDIPDVKIIAPRVFADARGYFFESFSQQLFQAHVGPVTFVQDNESKSTFGVIRGLHYQLPPFAQAKLVRVVQGRALDVAVDVRQGSPTFGRHVAVELSDQNQHLLFIPQGFAHGFAVLSPTAIFQYKCDSYYSPAHEAAIRWNDPALGIRWMLAEEQVIVSDKDRAAPLFAQAKYC